MNGAEVRALGWAFWPWLTFQESGKGRCGYTSN